MPKITDLKHNLDRYKESYQLGTILTVTQDKNNFIHAIIQKDESDIADPSHVDSLIFNDYNVGPNGDKKLLAMLFIPITNLIGNAYENIESYVGMRVKVRLVDGIARDAIVLPEAFLSFSQQKTIKKVLTESKTKDVLDKEFENEISELLGLELNDLGFINLQGNDSFVKVVVPSGHATTDQKIQNENTKNDKRLVLKEEITTIQGNNLLSKMKTALCHTPAKFLSGK